MWTKPTCISFDSPVPWWLSQRQSTGTEGSRSRGRRRRPLASWPETQSGQFLNERMLKYTEHMETSMNTEHSIIWMGLYIQRQINSISTESLVSLYKCCHVPTKFKRSVLPFHFTYLKWTLLLFTLSPWVQWCFSGFKDDLHIFVAIIICFDNRTYSSWRMKIGFVSFWFA